MSVGPPQRPRTRAALLPHRTTDPAATQRAVSDIKQKIDQVDASGVLDRQVITTDLNIGTNTINHGLGRSVRGYTVTPTQLDATFAHAFISSDEHHLVIAVDGALAQTSATLEVF